MSKREREDYSIFSCLVPRNSEFLAVPPNSEPSPKFLNLGDGRIFFSSPQTVDQVYATGQRPWVFTIQHDSIKWPLSLLVRREKEVRIVALCGSTLIWSKETAKFTAESTSVMLEHLKRKHVHIKLHEENTEDSGRWVTTRDTWWNFHVWKFHKFREFFRWLV